MANHVKAPEPLAESGDASLNWRIWKGQFMSFMKLTDYISAPMNVKVEHLRNQIGKAGLIAIESCSFDKPEDKNNMDILLTKLDSHFNCINEVVERFNFFTTTWKNNMSIERYIAELIEKAKTCNFGKSRNSLIIDKIIMDVKDEALRKKYFDAGDLNISKVAEIYNEHRKERERLKANTNANTNVINETCKDYKNDEKKDEKKEGENSSLPPHWQKPKNTCWRCKEHHALRQCPAWGSRCGTCQELHHRTGCCRNKFPKNRDTYFSKAQSNTKNPTDKNLDYKHADGVKHGLAVNTAPTAPEIVEVNNTLYPNLNHIKNTGKNYNSNTPTWQQGIRNEKHNETFQKRPSMPVPPVLSLSPPSFHNKVPPQQDKKKPTFNSYPPQPPVNPAFQTSRTPAPKKKSNDACVVS